MSGISGGSAPTPAPARPTSGSGTTTNWWTGADVIDARPGGISAETMAKVYPIIEAMSQVPNFPFGSGPANPADDAGYMNYLGNFGQTSYYGPGSVPEGALTYPQWSALTGSMPSRAGTSPATPPPTTPPPTTPAPGPTGPLPPSAFTPQLPSLGPAPGGTWGSGGNGFGGLKPMLNPYLLYLPQGRADAATAITGAPGLGGLLGGGS